MKEEELFRLNTDKNNYILKIDEEVFELPAFLEKLENMKLEENAEKELHFGEKIFLIKKFKQYFRVLFTSYIIDFFTPIILKINEQKEFMVFSTFQFRVIKKDYLQKEFNLIFNDKIVEEKTLNKYAGSTIYVQFKNSANQITLRQLIGNSSEYFNKESLEENVINSKKREDFEKIIKDFAYDVFGEKCKFYCGKSGIGKTTTLLDYRYKNKKNVFYINLRIIFKYCKTTEKFYEVLKNELAFLFDNQDKYNNFINDNDIFKIDNLILYNNSAFIYEKLKLIITKLIHYYNEARILLIILDQYKPKYDKFSQLFELLKIESQNYLNLKFLICSSINEEEIKNNIYNSIFIANTNREDKYMSIDQLIDDYEDEKLSEKQKKLFEQFGKLPKYYTIIKNCEDQNLENLKIKLKNELSLDIENSLNKLNLKNDKLESILQININEGTIVSREKLKIIYKFLTLKYISIIPQNQKENNIFIYNNDNTEYMIKYSFPVLKEVFKDLLKQAKKTENRKSIIFAEDAEEGILLEKLIYLSLDKNEKCFEEKISIEDSIEVNQLFECSQLYINPVDYQKYSKKENYIDLKEDEILKKIFIYGKSYHIYQHNRNGKKFDGGLLFGKANKNSFDLLIYQATKKKDSRKRLTNNEIYECKDMIKKNIEVSFDIKIDKVSFVYIMEYENQDLGLIEHCKSIENQLNFFFYSYEKDKFVNRRGKEIKIAKYLKEIKPLKNIINCMPKNKGRNLDAIKKIIDNVPSDLELNENNLLGKKIKRKENNKNYGNFMELYSKNEKKIFTLSSKEKNHDEILKNNKLLFFNQFNDVLNKSKENKNEEKEHEITTKKEMNIEMEDKKIKNEEKISEKSVNVDNNAKNSAKNKALKIKNILDNYLKDILIYNPKKARYDFTDQYNIQILDFFKINTDNQKYSSLFNDIMDINILANPLEFPFYYLLVNKRDKDDKLIVFKRKENFQIYDLKKKQNKTNGEFKNLVVSMIQNELYEYYYVIVCAFMA